MGARGERREGSISREGTRLSGSRSPVPSLKKRPDGSQAARGRGSSLLDGRYKQQKRRARARARRAGASQLRTARPANDAV